MGPDVVKRLTRAVGVLGIGMAVTLPAWAGDEPGLFERLFRGGGSPPVSRPSNDPPRTARPGGQVSPFGTPAPALLPPPTAASQPGAPPSAPLTPVPFEPSAPPASAPAQRIRPQPRTSTAVTDAAPILTRVALGRADDGRQFGMFLQVYADGTVLDGEGAHRVGGEVMRNLMHALHAPELGRLEGHCGAPPTDFIEQVYITVYQPARLGGVRVNSFSFSGNPQGCDPAVRNLHAAIEKLVEKLAGAPASEGHSTTPPPAPAFGAATGPDPSTALTLTPGD